MEKLTLTRLKRTQRTSSKTGRPFTSLGIQCKEYGEKWLSGFDGKETQDWTEGSIVEVEIEKKGDYVNFSVPKSSHQVNKMGGEDMVKLHAKLDAIWTKLGVIQGLIQPKVEEPRREFDTTDEREADIKPEDMPW